MLGLLAPGLGVTAQLDRTRDWGCRIPPRSVFWPCGGGVTPEVDKPVSGEALPMIAL